MPAIIRIPAAHTAFILSIFLYSTDTKSRCSAEEKCKLVEVGKERRYLKLQCGDKFKCPRSDTLYSVEDYKDDPKWNKWAVVCTLKYDTLCPNDPKFYEVCGHSRAGCKGDPSETMFCGAYICGYQDQVYTYMDSNITFGRKLLSGIVNTRSTK